MAHAEFLCGYDIRREGRRNGRDPERITYYLVGKHRWTGLYKSFRKCPDTIPNVRN